MNIFFIHWIYCMNLLPDQKQKAYDTKDFSNKNCRDLKYQYNSPKPFLHSSISPQSPSCFCCKFLLCCSIAYLPIYVRTKRKRSFKPNHLIIKGNTEVALPRRKRTNWGNESGAHNSFLLIFFLCQNCFAFDAQLTTVQD